MCPTSNLQTMPFLKGDLRNHPLQRMLDENVGPGSAPWR